jgi:predicted ATPase
MYALFHAAFTYLFCGDYATVSALADGLVTLAEEKGAVMWKAFGIMNKGCALALSGKASDAIRMVTSGIITHRRTGATAVMPLYLAYLARAYLDLGQFDDAWRCIGEAITAVETTKEKRWEAEVNRIAGEIVLLGQERDTTKAKAYFEHSLSVARRQQAKSWELRAAMSMARLWRDQGKRNEACDLLAPVYSWFTEGFDTSDLKEAKALLDSLAA